MNIRETLPVRPSDDQQIRPEDEMGDLDICGLMAQPRMVTAAELVALPRTRRTERIVCEDGWAVERLTWEGIPLRDALSICAPLPEARFAQVYAGRYWHALPLDELDHMLLCDRLNHAPSARERSPPWRLALYEREMGQQDRASCQGWTADGGADSPWPNRRA